MPEVQAVAAHITAAPGGAGALREVVEMILRGQNRWDDAVAVYLGHLRGATAGQ
ncbi:MAG: hypothetical protein BWY76_01631 [bacterium ADurb.Bin429]|nr:MAG: hypothetical protein BWY76_01631 [bacterium ADurb.Bin429]